MISNHTKGAILFASIYILVFLFSTLLYAAKPELISTNPSIANAVVSTPTAHKSTSNIFMLVAELVIITIVAISEMKFKLVSKFYIWFKTHMNHIKRRYVNMMKILIYLLMWVLVLRSLGAVWFIFLFVNSTGVLLVYFTLLRKVPSKQLIGALITFISFFILWPFSFLIVGHNTILLLFMDFAYIPIVFLISGLVMRNPTKNKINSLAFLFSVLLPPIIGTLFLPLYAIMLLGIFAVYDFIAVFWTKHMGFMAQKLIALNVPEAFLIGDFNQIKEKVKNINQTEGTNSNIEVKDRPLIFGVGDAILPGAVIASFTLSGLHYLAIAAVIGAILGVLANLGVLRIKKHILPALPLIFVGMLIFIAIFEII